MHLLHLRDVAGAGHDPTGVSHLHHRGFDLVGVGGTRLRLVDTVPPTPDGAAEVIVPDAGVSVTLPVAAEVVAALVVRRHPDPVVMRAFDGDVEVGSNTLAGDQEPGVLRVDADRITRVVVGGGRNGGAARRAGRSATPRAPAWRPARVLGRVPLPPDAELDL